MSEKKRLDTLLFERSLAKSREQARALLMSGIVYVDGKREDKPGASFADTEKLRIELRGEKPRFVSRGGLKLEKALRDFNISLAGLSCMDVGSSTGGFTDCMLQNGAKKVYAVDVGHGQLDWKLRNDPRVSCLERTNARFLTPQTIDGEILDFAAIDVSFISLALILPALKSLLGGKASVVCLIKPQFEAGREKVGKNGVVKDPMIQKEAALKVTRMAMGLSFGIMGFTFSPIKGPKGNIEFLLYLSNQEETHEGMKEIDETIGDTVYKAHQVLGR